MSHLSREVIKKIKEEREMKKTNSKLEHDNICELIYSNLVSCLSSNHTKSSKLINVPNLMHNSSIYIKDCFKENYNLVKLEKDLDIYYNVPSSTMLKSEDIKIEYDFSNSYGISCKTVYK